MKTTKPKFKISKQSKAEFQALGLEILDLNNAILNCIKAKKADTKNASAYLAYSIPLRWVYCNVDHSETARYILEGGDLDKVSMENATPATKKIYELASDKTAVQTFKVLKQVHQLRSITPLEIFTGLKAKPKSENAKPRLSTIDSIIAKIDAGTLDADSINRLKTALGIASHSEATATV